MKPDKDLLLIIIMVIFIFLVWLTYNLTLRMLDVIV